MLIGGRMDVEGVEKGEGGGECGWDTEACMINSPSPLVSPIRSTLDGSLISYLFNKGLSIHFNVTA